VPGQVGSVHRGAGGHREVRELLGEGLVQGRLVAVGVEQGAGTRQLGRRRDPGRDGHQLGRLVLVGEQAVHVTAEALEPGHLQLEQGVDLGRERLAGVVDGVEKIGQRDVGAPVGDREHLAKHVLATVVSIPGHGVLLSGPSDRGYIPSVRTLSMLRDPAQGNPHGCDSAHARDVAVDLDPCPTPHA
jgi:hypothetical protein